MSKANEITDQFNIHAIAHRVSREGMDNFRLSVKRMADRRNFDISHYFREHRHDTITIEMQIDLPRSMPLKVRDKTLDALRKIARRVERQYPGV